MHGVFGRAREGSYIERGPDGGDILVVPGLLGLSPLFGVTELEMPERQRMFEMRALGSGKI